MLDLETTILSIRHFHRQRVFAMDQRKRSDLALGAFMRTQLGWRKDLPADEAKAIREEAAAIIAGKADAGEYADIIAAAHGAKDPFEKIEASTSKMMGKLAKSLPVWESFAEPINGFGAVGLAIIVAEAGDLSNYPKKGHLWKRLGLAVIDGIAQGKLGKGASAAEWIEHGYNPERRSRIFTIGDSLIKKQNAYREIYLDRKAYEKTRAEMMGLQVVPAAKIPAKRADEFMSEGHVHRRAQRYMEQRLVRDLWQAWRDRENMEVVPNQAFVAISTDRAIEFQASA